MLNPPAPKLRRTGTKPVEAFGVDGCVRQSRVVLAPVAGVKSAETYRPNRVRICRQFADDGDKTNSSPGRARRKPLKPLRAGMPGDSGATVVTTLCLLPMHRGCGCIGHPAFPTPSMGREIFARARAQCVAAMRTHIRPPPGRAKCAPDHRLQRTI